MVREEQPVFWGHTPRYGDIGIRMRGDVTARSMFAFWLSGIGDEPQRSGEICVAEIFGSGIERGSAEVGIGLHSFRDPALTEDFTAERYGIDVSDFHDYAVIWRHDGLTFTIDGDVVRRLSQAPGYPVQLMIGLFDFPDRALPGDSQAHSPEMWVSDVWSRPLG